MNHLEHFGNVTPLDRSDSTRRTDNEMRCELCYVVQKETTVGKGEAAVCTFPMQCYEMMSVVYSAPSTSDSCATMSLSPRSLAYLSLR